jgi:hypothetical protein
VQARNITLKPTEPSLDLANVFACLALGIEYTLNHLLE